MASMYFCENGIVRVVKEKDKEKENGRKKKK